MAHKSFRAFNGCHEHNFLAITMLGQTRRLQRKLYQVWYDLRNAFGFLPQDLCGVYSATSALSLGS